MQAQQRFKTVVTGYLVSLGARPGSFYDYELDTPAGNCPFLRTDM
jgi:hypothetical protein